MDWQPTEISSIERQVLAITHAIPPIYRETQIYVQRDVHWGGGLELPAKVVQERLGHSSITVTLDTYGHLFPRGDDSAKLSEAESRLWS
jgi:integrase